MSKQTDKKKAGTGIGCLVLVVFIACMMYICGVFDPTPSSETSSKPSYIDLNALVRFTGTQFVITNNNNFDWTNVKLEINSRLLKSGYKLNANVMIAGQAYTVGAMQFAKSDGTKFNPFSMKALSMSIFCDTSRGEGFYYGSWE